MRHKLSTAWALARDTIQRFDHDNGDLLAAGIAFYVLLSLPPLSLVAVTVAGFVLGPERARGTLLSGIERSAGSQVSDTVARVLDAARDTVGQVAGVIAALLVVWAATRLFVQLQSALNVIWGVRPSTRNARELAKHLLFKRLLSFGMVIGCGALVLLLVALEATLSVFAGAVAQALSAVGAPLGLLRAQELIVSTLLLTASIAAVYHVLPDVRIPWRDVLVGSFATAVLVRLGAFVISVAVSSLGVPGMYGALGWLAILMLWTYHLALVFLIGAAFTRVLAEHRKGRLTPEPHAELEPRDSADAASAADAADATG